jgi:beta-galactosidase
MTIIGAQYYRPPNPPRADWPRDLRLMAASGMNTVKFWACWSWINGTQGTYDFDDLDELMDLAGEAGLDVVINTILENAPYWLEEHAPHARYVDHEGRAIQLTAAMNTPGGGWPGLCFDNEEVWQHAGAFLTALVDRYDGHPALKVWDVWNEPHLEPASYYPERMYCYCDASIAAFTGWLQQKYATLDDLNRSWARRYSSWSQVKPPRVFESVPDLMDWRAFWFDNLAAWLKRRTEIVRAAASSTTVMTHVALSGFTGQLATHTLDEFTLTDDVDVFGTSSFPTWLMADDHVEHLMNLDTARDAAGGKPFWQAEIQGGRGRRAGTDSTAQPAPEVVQLWMWNSLAAGASGIVFWQWRPELLGPESPGYGLTTPDGTVTARVEAASGFAAIARQPELGGLKPDLGSVALLLSRGSALHAFATDHRMDLYTDAAMGAYRLLVDADIPFRILHEDRVLATGVPNDVTSVYWPMPTVASDALSAELRRFVGAGGVLVSEASPGEYDELGRRRATVPGAGLAEVFGLVQHETTIDDARISLSDGGELEGAWQRESLRIESAEPVGHFRDGTPGMTSHAFGSGTAVLVATYPSLAYHLERSRSSREAIVGLLGAARSDDAGWVEPSPGLVSRRSTNARGQTILFAINWTREPADFVASPGASRLEPSLHGQAAAIAPGAHIPVPARTGIAIVLGEPPVSE